MPWAVALLLIVAVLSGCSQQPAASAASSRTEEALPATSLPVDTSEPVSTVITAETLPTATRQAGDELITAGEAPLSPEPTRPTTGVDPLHFVFPTPRPHPVSAWRPPLYPLPWAPTIYDHFYFSRPIAANEVNWPLADYRYGGVFFEDVVHTGVDIPSPPGTPVLAAGSGKVTWAGTGLYALSEDDGDPYGIAVAIRHDFGYQGDTLYTVYGHMKEIFVEKGQHVDQGDVVGLVGSTGKTTGPHLHFEVRVGKNNFFGSRNPELWIAPPQGWGVLAGRMMGTGGLLLEHYLLTATSLETGQLWEVKSYGAGSVNRDPYYNENVVLGDLPAGRYEIEVLFVGRSFTTEVEILPGMVTYFNYQGRNGFNMDPPPSPGANFEPETPAGGS